MELENFSWESASSPEDFFKATEGAPQGIIIEPTEEGEEEIEESKKDPKPQDPVRQEMEEDMFLEGAKTSEDLFGQQTVSEEIEEQEKTLESDLSTLKYLEEVGIFTPREEDEEEDLSLEQARERLVERFEETIDTRLKEMLDEIPSEAKRLIDFALQGGSIHEYVNQIARNSGTNLREGMDMDEEENQIKVVKSFLKNEGEDDEFINTQIDILKESDRLESYAKNRYDKWLKDSEEEKENMVEQQRQAKIATAKTLQEDKKNLTKFLNATDNVGGLTTNRELKKDLPSYIHDKNIKLENGVTISALQRDLFYELPKSQVGTLQLAILLKNRNEDGSFNFDSIKRELETKVTKDMKKDLRRSKTTSGKSGPRAQRSLADFF